jgi:hypothetical protein
MNPTLAPYEPPISEEGSPLTLNSFCARLLLDKDELLYKGVFGYAIKYGDEIFIPLIEAVREGSGHVGQFLDRLTSGSTNGGEGDRRTHAAAIGGQRGRTDRPGWTSSRSTVNAFGKSTLIAKFKKRVKRNTVKFTQKF